jgi:hypothetical protein
VTTLAEKKHMSRVADLGCAVCRRMGTPGTPAELHHRRAGTGAGRRSSHWEVIPLCPEHHRGSTGLHGLGTKGFPKHWGFDETDLLVETLLLVEKQYGEIPLHIRGVLLKGVDVV